MPCSRSDLRLGVAAVALLCALQLPYLDLAHAKELGWGREGPAKARRRSAQAVAINRRDA